MKRDRDTKFYNFKTKPKEVIKFFMGVRKIGKKIDLKKF